MDSNEPAPPGTPARRMIISRISAFPSERWSGMTYRQWLIGMALQGFCACDSVDANDRAVDLAFDIADKVIDRLADELRQDGK